MTMTLDKLDVGSGVGRPRRHADSPCAPMMVDSFYIDIPAPGARSISPLSASVSPGKDKTFSFFKSVYRKISLKSMNGELDQLHDGAIGGDEDDSRSSSVDSCSSISDRDRDQQLLSPATVGADKDSHSSSGRCSSASKLQLKLSNLALSSLASSDSAVSSCSRAESTKESIETEDDGPEEEEDEEEGNGGRGGDGAKENRRKSRRSSVLKLLESLAIHAPMRSRSLSCSNSSVNNLLHSKGRESRAESKCSLFSTNSASHDRSSGRDGMVGGMGKDTSSKPPPKRILRRPVSYTYLRGISGLPTQRVPRSSICCSYYGR